MLIALGCPGVAGAFQLGIFEPSLGGPEAPIRAHQIARSGGSMVRVEVTWPAVTTRQPDAPGDPRDPAYDWRVPDRAVRAARNAGLRVLLSFSAAPAWAEGPNRPGAAAPGSWKPRPGAVGAFAAALARRYAGQARDFEIWNEPNLNLYLSPQYAKAGRSYRPVAAFHYRRMLNAAYAAIKGVSHANRVFTAGTAPYGEPPPGGGPAPFRPYDQVSSGGARTQPTRFWRQLLCLRGNLSRGACPDPVHFDVLDHHPYPIAGPRHHAASSADVAIPDIHKLSRILAAARRHGTVLPRGHKGLAVTEISWDSRPPDPNGVPAWRHAAWLSDMLYMLWKQHVQTVLWFRVIDQAPIPSFALTNQSGLYLRSGRPKPAQRAFAFPFACERGRLERYRIWGMAPRPSRRVTIQLRDRGRWRTVRGVRAGRDRVFTAARNGPAYQLRAIQGGRVSLSCALDALGK